MSTQWGFFRHFSLLVPASLRSAGNQFITSEAKCLLTCHVCVMLLVSVSNFLHHHDDIVCKQAPRFTPFIFSQFYLPESVTTTGPNQLHYIVTNNTSLIAEVVFRLRY